MANPITAAELGRIAAKARASLALADVQKTRKQLERLSEAAKSHALSHELAKLSEAAKKAKPRRRQ